MMSPTTNSPMLLLLLLLSMHSAAAFTVSQHTDNMVRLPVFRLNAFGLSVDQPENDAQMLMNHARECAYSDSCSVEEAQQHLREVVHVQSGCVAGTVNGHDVCEDQITAAEIVALLRRKVELAAEQG